MDTITALLSSLASLASSLWAMIVAQPFVLVVIVGIVMVAAKLS